MNIFKRTLVLIGIIVGMIILSSCGKSVNIKGQWYAQEASGKNLTIEFTDDKVILEGQSYDYDQKGIGVKNNVEYVFFEQNGVDYSIIFPDKDQNIAVLIQPNSEEDFLTGQMLYALNREEEPDYNEYVSEYFN